MYTTSSPVSVGALDPTSMLRLLPIAVCVLGLLMVFREVLFLGGAVQLNDAADPRFNEFLLEHSWRWLQGFEAGGVFELSVGYPSTNTLGYSEPMISFGPLYWPFRALGLSTATSYSYWLVATAVVNFFCFYFFTRKSLGLGIVAACVSAFLFAFGLPRVAQIGHSQLWPQFYVVLVLWGMYVLFLGAATERTQRIGAVAVIGGLVLQAWGCLYNAIFVGYVCLVTVTFALLHPAWRANALRTLRVVTPVALCCLVAAMVFVWPLIRVYLAVGASTPDWDLQQLQALQPRPSSLLYVWNSSWFYPWMTTATSLGSLPARHEQALGMGLLTTAIVLYTLVRNWRKPVVQLLFVAVLFLLLPTLMWPEDRSLWVDLREWIPGLSALRAISRIGLLLLIPASIALGVFVERRSEFHWPRACLAVAILCLVEQGTEIHRFSRAPYERVVASIAEGVDPNAEAFYYVGAGLVPFWYGQIDAMLAAQRAGVPTVNMFSGRYPAGYSVLHRNVAVDTLTQRQVEQTVNEWLEQNHIDPDRVQLIFQAENLRTSSAEPTGRSPF